MGKVVYGFHVSLDGFIEDRSGGFDWFVPDEALHRHHNEHERDTGLHLYGRGLYDVMRFWASPEQHGPVSEVEREYARYWQRVPTTVYSRTLQSADPGVRIVREVDPAEVARLAASTEGKLSLGGASLAAEFRRLGLIDEYWVYVVPIVVGGGKPMFQGEAREPLRLLATEQFASGTTLLRYERA